MSTARHLQRFLGRSWWIVLLIVCCAVNAQAAAVAYTWTGGSNTLWNNSGNWSPSGIPTTGDSVIFAGGTAINLATSNDIGAISLTAITMGAGLTGNVSIAGSAITLSTATGIDASAADRDLTITAALTLGTGLSFTVASGRLVTVGAITNGANLLTIAGAGNVTISGVLGASTGGLTMNSTGTLTLSGVNTYTGLNTLNAGTVVVTQETNLGAVANDVTFGGGTLRISGSFTSNAAKIFTVPALTSGTLQIDGGVTLTDATATTLVVGVGGALIKTGTGGLLVQNQNTTFDGTLRIDAGTVEMRGAFDNAFGDTTNRATVAVNGGTYTISDTAARAMAHSLSVYGASTLVSERSAVGAPLLHTVYDITLAGGSNLTVQPGTNCAGTAGTAGISGTNSTLILGQSSLAVANGATASTRLTLRALNESGGFRQLTKTGSGDLYLSATATAWTGTVDVQAGTLTVAAANALGTTSEVWLSGSTTMRVLNDSSISTGAGIRLFGNATLNVDRLAAGSNQTHTNRFIAAGTSTLTVSNANGYSCALSGLCDTGTGAISAGAIPLTVGSLSGAGTVTTTGLVTVGSDNTSTTFAGNRTGAGALTKTGTGNLTLTGANDYSGATTISAGTLTLRGASGAIASSSGVTIAAAATLHLDNVGAANADRIGTVGVTMQGATLRLSGDGSGCSETIGALTFSNAADTVILTPAGSNHAVLTATSVVTGTGLATIQRVDGGGSGTGRLMVSAGLSDGQYLSWAQVTEGGVTAPARYTTAQGIVAQGSAVWFTRQSGNWDDQATWRDGVSGTPISTDEVEIRGHAVSLNSVGRTCAALSFTTASGSVTAVSGESLTVTSGNCCVQGAITGTVSSAAVMSDTANRWFATTAGGQLVLGGAVSGLGTVRIGGAGVVSLGGSNSFSGVVTVASGTLRCAANNVLADAITISVASGATFDLAGRTDTIAAVALPSGANLALGSGTLSVFGDNSSPTLSGTISGSGTLRKIGSGTLTLASTRGTWTGGVAVDDGTVTLTAARAVGTGTSTVALSKTLNPNLADCLNGSTVTVSGTLTTSNVSALNAATVNIASGGTANANGANCLNAGTVNVATGGSLTATVASALASGTVNLTGGTLRLINNAATAFAGTVVVATSGSTVLVDRASGVGAVEHSIGILTLNATPLNLTNGNSCTFRVTTKTNLGIATSTIAQGAINITLGGIDDAGNARTYQKTGSGTLLINVGRGTWTGGLDHSTAGVVTVSIANGLSTGTSTVAAGLTMNSTINQAFNGSTVRVSGILDLTASTPLNGGTATVLSGGVVNATASGVLTSGTVNLSGGTLNLRNNAATAFAGTVTVSAPNSTISVDRVSSGSGLKLSVAALNLGSDPLLLSNGNTYTFAVTGTTTLQAPVCEITQNGVPAELTTITDGGLRYRLRKAGVETLTIVGSRSNWIGGIDLTGGTVVLSLTDALGLNDTVVGTGAVLSARTANVMRNAAVSLNGGTLDMKVNGSSACGGFVSLAADSTILVDNFSAGTGYLHSVQTLGLGTRQLTVNQGNSCQFAVVGRVESGSGSIAAGAVPLTFGSLNGGGSGIATTGGLTTGSDGTTSSWSGALSGTGCALTKAGSGVMTMSGANTFSGSTAISGGGLTLSGAAGAIANSSGITLSSGTTLTLDNSAGQADRLGTVGVTMNGATLNLIAPSAGVTETIGTVTVAAGLNTFGLTPSTSGDAILDCAGISPTAGTVTVRRNSGGGSGVGRMLAAGFSDGQALPWATVVQSGVTSAAMYSTTDGICPINATWYSRQNGNWDDQTTWRDGASGTPPANADIEIRGHAVSLNGADRTCNALAFSTGSGSISATAAEQLIVTTGAITAGGAITGTVSAPLTISAGTNLLTAGSGSVLSLTGAIAGSGPVEIPGSGRVELGGANSFSGAVTLRAGVLRSLADGILPDAQLLTVVGGMLDLNGHAETVGSLVNSGIVRLANGTLTIGGDGTSFAIGNLPITAGTLVKAGAGTMTCAVTSPDCVGTLRIDAGVAKVTNGAALGGATVALNGGTYRISNTTNITVANPVQVLASSTLEGEPTDFSGFSFVHTLGTLTISSGVNLSVQPGPFCHLTAFTAGLVFGATQINGDATIGVSSTVSGGTTTTTLTLGALNDGGVARTVTKATLGATQGLIQLNAAATAWSGNWTVNAGTLIANAANCLGTGSATANAGTFVQATAANALNGGTVTLAGGTLQLRGNAATAFGGTVVQTAASTINVDRVTSGSNLKLSIAALTLDGNTLVVSNGNGYSFEVVGLTTLGAASCSINQGTVATEMGGFTDGGNGRTFTKSGTGTLTVDGSRSNWTGLMAISAGTATLTAANALGTGTSTMIAATTLNASANNCLNGSTLTMTGGTFTVVAGVTSPLNGAAVTVTGGTFNDSNSTEPGNLTGGTITLNGGTLNLKSDVAMDFSGSIVVTATSTINVDKVAAAVTGLLLRVGTLSVGTSTLNVTNANSFQFGSTGLCSSVSGTIAGGAVPLQLGSLSGSGTITSTALLTVGSDGTSTTFAGTRTGTAGSLAKTGAGVLTLSGNHAHTGTTTVSGGTLRLAGDTGRMASAASTTVAFGATLDIDATGTANPDRLGDLAPVTLKGGTLSLACPTGVARSETIGALTLFPGTASTVIAGPAGSGDATLNCNGVAADGTVTVQRTTSAAGVGRVLVAGIANQTPLPWATAVEGVPPGTASAAMYSTADGIVANAVASLWYTRQDGLWSDQTTWLDGISGTPPATADVDIRHAVDTNAATRTCRSVRFTTNSGSIGGSGNLAVSNGAVSVKGAVDGTISCQLVRGSNGPLSVEDPARTLTVSGQIIGAALVVGGSGVVRLSGTGNAWGGSTTVGSGTLRALAADQIPDAAALTVLNGATWDLNGYSDTLSGSPALPGSIALGGGILSFASDNSSVTWTGALSGAGTVVKYGTGTLSLTGASPAFTGLLRIDNGNLALYHAQALGAPGSKGSIELGYTTASPTVNLYSYAGADIAFDNPVTVVKPATFLPTASTQVMNCKHRFGAMTVPTGSMLLYSRGDAYFHYIEAYDPIGWAVTNYGQIRIASTNAAAMVVNGRWRDAPGSAIYLNATGITTSGIPAPTGQELGLHFSGGSTSDVYSEWLQDSLSSRQTLFIENGTTVTWRGFSTTSITAGSNAQRGIYVRDTSVLRMHADANPWRYSGSNMNFFLLGPGTGTVEFLPGFSAHWLGRSFLSGISNAVQIGSVTFITNDDGNIPDQSSGMNFSQDGASALSTWRVQTTDQVCYNGANFVNHPGVIDTITNLTLTGAGFSTGSPIGWNAAVTKTGAGKLTIANRGYANSGTGTLTIAQGEVLLAGDANKMALAGVTIGDGAGGSGADVLRFQANNQLQGNPALAFAVASSGEVFFANTNQVVGSLNCAGRWNLGSGAANTVTVRATTSDTFTGVFMAHDSGDQIVKTGTGIQTIAITDDSANISILVDQGTLHVNGSLKSVPLATTGTGAVAAGSPSWVSGAGQTGWVKTLDLGGDAVLKVRCADPVTGCTRLHLQGDLLRLAGRVQVTDAGGLAAGTYTVIDYTGYNLIANSGLAVDPLPSGLAGIVDTSVPGLVRLIVSADTGNRYWVGDVSTDWGNASNWSTVSGGGDAPSIPSLSNPVIFDGGAVRGCTLSAASAARSLRVASDFQLSIADQGQVLQVADDVTLHANMTYTSTGWIELTGDCDLTSGGQVLGLRATGGRLKLVDNLTTREPAVFRCGTVDWNSRTWDMRAPTAGTYDLSWHTNAINYTSAVLRTTGPGAITLLWRGQVTTADVTTVPIFDIQCATTIQTNPTGGTVYCSSPVFFIAPATTLTVTDCNWFIFPGTGASAFNGTRVTPNDGWGTGGLVQGNGLMEVQTAGNSGVNVWPDSTSQWRADTDIRLGLQTGGSWAMPAGTILGRDLIFRSSGVTAPLVQQGNVTIGRDFILDTNTSGGAGGLSWTWSSGSTITVGRDLVYQNGSVTGVPGTGSHQINTNNVSCTVDIGRNLLLGNNGGTLTMKLGNGTWTVHGTLIDLAGVDVLTTGGTSTFIIANAATVIGNNRLFDTVRLSPGAGATVTVTDTLAANSLAISQAGAVTVAGGGAIRVTATTSSLVRNDVPGSEGAHVIQTGVILPASNAEIVNASSDATLDLTGVISGGSTTGILTCTGPGTTRLAGANTYAGATTIASGIVRQTAAGVIPDASAVSIVSGATWDLAGYSETVGSLAGGGTVTLGSGTLSCGNDGTSTSFTGSIGGAGSLTKIGAGVQTIGSALAYSGTTTVSAGTLRLTGDTGSVAASTAMTIASSGTLDIDSSGTSDLDHLGNTVPISLSGGTLRLACPNDISRDETVGVLTLASGQSTIAVVPQGTGQATLRLTSISVVAGSLVVQRDPVSGANLGQVFVAAGLSDGEFLPWAVVVEGGVSYPARYSAANGIEKIVTLTWATRQAGPWDDQATWRDGVSGTPPSDADVQILHAGINLNGADRSCRSVTFTATGSITGGNVLAVTSGSVTGFGTITATIACPLTVAGPLAMQVSSGGTMALSGAVTATTVTMNGGGLLTLSNPSNAWTGATTITAGTLRLLAASCIPDGSAVSLSSGATLDGNGFSETVGSISGGGAIALGAGALTCGGDNSTTTLTGVISGTGSLTKAGSGALTLGGTNTYTGTTTVSAGTLLLAGAGACASPVTVAGSATLGGTGNVGAAITVQSGGIVDPGLVGARGILSAVSADFSAGGILNIDVAGLTTAGTSFDRLALSGSLTGGGTSVLRLNVAALVALGTTTGVATYASKTNLASTSLTSNALNYSATVTHNAASLDVAFAAVPSQTAQVSPIDCLDENAAGPTGDNLALYGRTLNPRPAVIWSIPSAPSGNALHFDLYLSGTSGLSDPVISTRGNQTGFAYFNGTAWTAFPFSGVRPGANRLVRYTPPTALAVDDDYFWKVRAGDASSLDNGPFSGVQRFLIGSRTWTDATLTAGGRIRAVHLTELRTETGYALAMRGLPAAWTDSITPNVTLIRAVHLTELRSAMSTIAAQTGSAAVIGAQPVATGTLIRPSHITELRTALGGL